MSDKRQKNMEAMAMKMLRQERAEAIARARDAIKEQNRIISAIRKALADGPLTVPELAERVSMETELVLRYVSTLKKYGVVGEDAKDGDYFRYGLIA